MIKKLFVILLVFGVVLSMTETNLAQKTFKMGIYSGINLAGADRELLYNTTYMRNVSFSNRMGMVFGVMAELQLAGKLYLQPEFRYIQKGGQVKNEQFFSTSLTNGIWREVKEVEKLDYLEVPILFKFAFAKPGGFKPYILAGPTFGSLSSAESEIETEGNDEKQNLKVKDFFKSSDVGVDLGVGFDYPITPKMDLFVDGRFSLGLSEIQETESAYTKYKNQGIQVLVGLKYCFSGCGEVQEIEETTREPEVIKEFDLADYNVPFFVTGYYRPNTAPLLDDLRERQKKELKAAAYIENIQGKETYAKYKIYADQVNNIFHTIYVSGTEEIFPHFASTASEDEILEITIYGYSDPRGVSGKYFENQDVPFEDVSGNPHVVTQGDELDNLKLSGLRAWYSGQLMDQIFISASEKGNTTYQDLKNDNKIVYRYVGGNIPGEGEQFDAQRRIRVIFTRVPTE